MAEGGRRTGGRFVPDERSIPLRHDTLCAKCARPLVFWRDLGDVVVMRCGGPDRAACSALVTERNLARQAAASAATKAAKEAARAQSAAAHREAVLAQREGSQREALARRHRLRRWTCHRPDKIAHETQEGAEVQRAGLILLSPATTANLRTYLCRCTFWHVGNRPPAES